MGSIWQPIVFSIIVIILDALTIFLSLFYGESWHSWTLLCIYDSLSRIGVGLLVIILTTVADCDKAMTYGSRNAFIIVFYMMLIVSGAFGIFSAGGLSHVIIEEGENSGEYGFIITFFGICVAIYQFLKLALFLAEILFAVRSVEAEEGRVLYIPCQYKGGVTHFHGVEEQRVVMTSTPI